MGGLVTEEELEKLKEDLARLTRGTVVDGPITATPPIYFPQVPALASAESLDALRAEVAALKARVEALEAKTIQPPLPKSCPICSSANITMRPYVPTSIPSRWWDCHACKRNWLEAI